MAFMAWSLPVQACTDYTSCPELHFTDPVQSGGYIAELQELLKSAGYYRAKVDGNYGPMTAEAVKKFQRDHGLAPNGTIEHKTWDALAALYDQAMASNPGGDGPKGEVSIYIDLNKNQLHILDDGKLFKTYSVATGKSKTPSPVGEYKIIHKDLNWGTGFGSRWMGINVPWGIYGIHGTNNPYSIGRSASHGCFRMYNKDVEEIFPWIPIGTRVLIMGYTPKFQGFVRPLKLKSSGQDVVMLQYRLKELGFGIDYADGRYGGLTEFAVKLFEAYHMLPVDGEADLKMLKRLDQYFPQK
ncbi:L,D-transpeptidase family protein [Candidatus Formimonas warabiya]|nr:peptidoglycan-binding protein [Candidatus Formimonas warabiya]